MAERDRIAEFKEVADLTPDDPVVRFGLAGAYLEAGQAENAVLEYEETIRLKPDYSAVWRRRVVDRMAYFAKRPGVHDSEYRRTR